MPIHLPPLTRRSFIVRSLAAGAGALSLNRLTIAGGPDTDPNRFALLADTHIPDRPGVVARGVNMTDHLRKVGEQLIALDPKPASVLINGDCAYLEGLPDDYANLARLLGPLSEADLPVHLTMGNHDDRQPLYEALAEHRPDAPPVDGRHASVLETPRANLFLLDSLWRVNETPGEIGPEQLGWLADALDAQPDKPAIVISHHYFQWDTERRMTGLRDTEDLFGVLEPRRHVKAFVFGHSHRWECTERAGIHLINLPAVAYVFREEHPSAWVDARIEDGGVALRLRCLDAGHPWHEERVDLEWRAGRG